MAGCVKLASITLPGSLTNIGPNAFSDCYSLKSITLPSGISSIAGYLFDGCSGLTNVVIPNAVTSIVNDAFAGCRSLRAVAFPGSVTNIGEYAFDGCSGLTSVYFQENAPALGPYVFGGYLDAIDGATVYYLPGTTGWGARFSGVPTASWTLPYPVILNDNPSFGFQTNAFGFAISWATNLLVTVEACTNLSKPVWTPVATNALSNGMVYFRDPQWTNCPTRFYRVTRHEARRPSF